MKKRIFKTIFFLIIGILLLFGYYFLNKKTGFSVPCMIHEITGYYCPGCGITRMFFALIKFNFAEAFRYNQLVFILTPFLVFYFFYHIYLYIFEKKDKILVKIPNYVYIILLIIVIAWGIVRNLEMFPFLRP
jgi:hypothetical protein